MGERIWVATRKGLFEVARGARGQWTVGPPAFVGHPVTMMLDDPRDGTLYAALNLGHFGVKLHRSEDRGRTWVECAAPAFPPAGEPGSPEAAAGPAVFQVWALSAAGAEEPDCIWAGTIPAALFLSRDRGQSWQLVRSLWDRPEREMWFGGGYDQPGIHSVLVDPRDFRRLTVGISCGGVWYSPDGGGTWECRAQGMFAEYMPPERRDDPNIQDPHRIAQCLGAPMTLWAQHHNGVFRSEDGGRNWQVVETVVPSNFGFAVAIHPLDPQTVWLVPAVKDECRVPVDGALVVSRTRDGGKSFEVLHHGLPQRHAYDLVYRHGLDVSANGQSLAIGSTTGGLWISESGGEVWSELDARLPPIYQVAFSR